MSYPQHPGYGPPPPQHYAGYGPPPPQTYQQQPQGPFYGAPPQQQYAQQPVQPQQPPPQQQQQQSAPAAPSGAPAVPFIGAYISLLSVLNVRYEGTLYTIDTKASTVALQNVRCFGTEDRPAPQFTPVDPHVYEFIIFGGKDIVDLSVLVQPTPQQAPLQPQQPQLQQPQQQQIDAPQQQQDQQQQQRGSRPPRQAHPPQAQGSRLSVRMIDESKAPAQPKPQEQKQQAPAPAAASSSSAPAAAAGVADFDFQGSNARFEKHTPASYAHAASASSSSSAVGADDSSVPSYDLPSVDSGLDTSGFPTVTKKYDKKKSFFDELGSGSSEQRVAASYHNQGQQRRVDVDTFGAEAQGFRSKHGRQGGGHRQGGQGQGQQQGQQGQGGQGGGQRRGGGGRGRNGNAPQGQWRGEAQ